MKMVTLPAAVLFGALIGLGTTVFLLARKTYPWYVYIVYILVKLVNCIIAMLVYAGAEAFAAWLGG